MDPPVVPAESGEESGVSLRHKVMATRVDSPNRLGSYFPFVLDAIRSKYVLVAAVLTALLLLTSEIYRIPSPLHFLEGSGTNGHVHEPNRTNLRKVGNGTFPMLGPLLASVLLAGKDAHITGPVPEHTYDRDFCADIPDLEFARQSSATDPVRWGERELGYRHLVIVSTGGVGTTYLMNGLKDALKAYGWRVNRPSAASPQRCWKHRYPAAGDLHLHQLGCWGADRIIYLFNDPVAQFQSLFRRGFGNALQEFGKWDVSPEHTAAFANIDTYVEAVVKHKRDLAGIQQHMMAWVSSLAPCPMFVADTRTLLHHMGILSRYLSVPYAAVSHLMWSTRNSSEIGENFRFPLPFLELYANVYEQMSAFDMTLIVPGNYRDPLDLHSIRPMKLANATTFQD